MTTQNMFLLINKPKDITSHDVIYKLRRITDIKRIGHAGTLDPNATGLLIVGIGRESTKKLGSLTKNTKKTYTALIHLGQERDTDDIEGKVTKRYEVGTPPTLKEVENVIKKFTGTQLQTPPAYSAIKIKGKKSYALARRGKSVKLEPRLVVVHAAKVLDYNFPILKIGFEVSSGTYIRSLARDIGRELGTGAYLKDLERTAIGKYKITTAHRLEDLSEENWEAFTINI